MKDKKKLTINTLAMGNLKQRKKQYSILSIGIILAMVFSSGIMFFVSCLQSSIEETKHRLYGTQHEIYLNATDIDFENGELTEFVREYSFAHTIGFAYHSEEKKDVGTAVAWLEDKAEEMYYPFLYEGRMPEKEGEAVIESLLYKGFKVCDGLGSVLGVELKLDLAAVFHFDDYHIFSFRVLNNLLFGYNLVYHFLRL